MNTSIFTFPPLNSSSPGPLSLQVYCLSPPNDSCEFGPCPNPDITGLGQQVSLYVTSTSLALIILYASELESRLSTYAHFANIYALLISAYISLGRGQLTQSDAVFVLSVVASPVSIYFWLWHLTKLPTIWKIRTLREFLWILMVFCSFALWTTMAGFVLSPLAKLPFSQPACKIVELQNTWSSLLWYFLYLVQNGFIILCCKVTQYRSVRGVSIGSEINIIEWTKTLLDGVVLPMTPHRIAAILFTIQVSVAASIPGRVFPFIPATALSGLLLILTFLLSGRPSVFFSSETFFLSMVNVLQPAPLLKFSHLIIIPHIAWIWATIVANPTQSTDITFGQLLALFLLFLPLWTVIEMVYTQRKVILRALWMTETFQNLPTTGIPLTLVTTAPPTGKATKTLTVNDSVLDISNNSTMTLVSPNDLAPPTHSYTLGHTRRRVNSIG
ncbi:hypothetical protein BDZ94DRAFT_1324725 [Collybia nuda]|uniref:Uncharacterized protein n=1 Tax=Collybia nuda TaxID=64659 RepID=A0A9P5Y189_9AGAR|nr:hypothetical protein BDZ94DRAFT_1324725 [Collybia nuda]